MPNFTKPPKPIFPLALPFGFPNPQLQKLLPAKSEVPHPGPDPVLLEDFIALIERELGEQSRLNLTTEAFVNCVNAAGVLRYFFQDLTESELEKIGVRRQGYWLRLQPGCEHNLVSITQVAKLLHCSQI